MKKALCILLLIVLPYVAVGQYVKALRYDERSINKAFIQDTVRIDVALQKAISFPISKDKEALVYFERAAALAKKLKSQEQIAKAFLIKGTYYRDNFNYFEAIKSLNKALPYLENTKDSKNIKYPNAFEVFKSKHVPKSHKMCRIIASK